ncbi:glycosyltransferase family 4 protein [Streptomyces sp. HUAS ZL42]|uniref:glycosyltransferase family 4 protein n=1 Tax=Streptomyces sp. HUAS ZL42 TaxID=3231715 RepID=UPI00345E41D0
MRVAIAAPVDLSRLARLLDRSVEQTTPAGLGGPGTAALVAELASRGHDVTLVTLSREIDRPVHGRIGTVDVLIGPYRRRHRARNAFRQERDAVRTLLDSVDTDVVHAHWTYEFGLGALASRHPTLITVRDWAPAIMRCQPDAYRMVRLAMQYRCLTKARHLTAVSPYIGDRLRRWCRGATTVVPNGLPSTSFRDEPPTAHQPVRRLLSVNSHFSKGKNTSTLLRAFAAIRGQLEDVELTLVGSGHEPGGRAERWARGHGLADGVVFAGHMQAEQALSVMDTADIFVAPSLEESFGMTVLEAMARGLPVVAGRSSGAVPWLLDLGRAGELVDVRRPEAISQGVVRLARNADVRAHLSRQALARARLFAWPNVVPSYEAQYEHVARCV